MSDVTIVNWADVPSVVRLPGGALAAHWLQKSGASTMTSRFTGLFSKPEEQARFFTMVHGGRGR